MLLDRSDSKKHLGVLLTCCLAGGGFCGCAGYHFGTSTGASAGAKSIQVTPFRNETSEPRLIEPVVSALRKQLQQDGTFRLASRHDADIVLNGALLRYEREGVSFRPNDILTARDFNLRLTARITATERATGKTLVDREVTGRTSLRPGLDFASAERQASALLAEDLARIVTSLLADGAW
ncbi:MAG: hypothetical protein HY735_19675 [Verrucomicrobia bacterium]|nr:hypothetical protein [Verrucomicrobiota bacterium]